MKNKMIFVMMITSLALLSAGSLYGETVDTLWVGDSRGAPGNVGRIVTVNLNNAEDIAGLQFTLNYDPALLTPTGVSLADRAGVMSTCDWNVPAPGELRVIITDLAGAVIPAGSGPIAGITFSVDSLATQRGPTPLTLLNAVLSDAEAISISVVTSDGIFTITDGLTVVGGSGAPGSIGNLVPISLVNAGDIAGVQLTLNYDPTILTPTGVSSVGRAIQMGAPSWNVPSPGELRALLVNLSGEVIPPGIEPVLEIAFTVVPAAFPGDTAALSLPHVVLSDSEAQVVDVTPTDGYFIVTEAVAVDTLKVGEGKGVPGSSGNIVPVELANVEYVAGLQFSLGYDPARLTPAAVSFVGRVSGMGGSAWNVPAPGQLRVAISDPGGGAISPGTGSIVEVAFDVADTALIGDIPLPLSEVVLSDTSASSIPVIPIDGLFTVSVGLKVSDSSGESGGSGTVPIEMVNTLDVAGVQFTLSYDSSVLTPAGVSFIGRADSMETSGWNVPTPGELRVVISSASGAVIGLGTGSIAQVSFNIASVSAQDVPLSLAGVMLSDVNAQPIPVIPTDGVFTVTAAPPVADFSASPTSGTAPLTVNFTNLSTGTISTYAWSFGDGGTSSLKNPSHTYGAGTYTVSLTVTGPAGSDTKTRTDYITVSPPPPPAPVADFSASPTSGVVPLTVQFTDKSSGTITGWSWDFGDGSTSTQRNPRHTYTTVDTFTVILTVGGPGGADTETKSDYIKVKANTPPVITPILDTVAVEDSLYSYDVEATDDDGDTLTYSLVVHPVGMAIDPSTGLISWTPTNVDVGLDSVEVRVADGRGGTDSQSFTITVVNTPPTISSVPDTVVVQDSLYMYDIESDDEGSGNTFYSLLIAPGWLALQDSTTGVISGTPENEDVGDTTVTIQVDDGNGGTASQTYTLHVLNVNDPPVIAPIPDTTAWVSKDFVYKVDATDIDGDSLIYSDDTDLFDIDAATGLIQFHPTLSDTGSYLIGIIVSDGVLTDSTTFTLAVRQNHAPVISPIGDREIRVAEEFVYQVEAYDPDGDSLGYLDDTELFDIDPISGLIRFSPTQADIGSYPITVTVFDWQDSSQVSFVWTVVATKVEVTTSAIVGPTGGTVSDPTGASIEIPEAALPEPVEITVGQVIDPPPLPENYRGLPTTFHFGPDGTEFQVPVTVRIPYTQEALDALGIIDPADLSVYVYDVQTRIWEEIPVTSIDRDNKFLIVEVTHFSYFRLTIANRVPIISSTPDTTAIEDSLYTYDVEATDPDGDSLTYSLEVSPDGMGIDPITGLITWLPANEDVGDTIVVIHVSDPDTFAMQSYVLHVLTVNHPPEIAPVADTTLTVGELYEYQIMATDVDGDSLSYFLVESPAMMRIGPDGLIEWLPPTEDIGQWVVRMRVSDPYTSVEETYTITVEGVGNTTVTVSIRQPVGPEGAILTSPEGVVVEIPAGALLDTVQVSIGRVNYPPPLPSDKIELGLAYYCGPDGLSFVDTLAVTVGIPFTQAQVDSASGLYSLQVYIYDIRAGGWGPGGVTEVDTLNNLIKIQVGHFSYFRLAIPWISVQMPEFEPPLPSSVVLHQNYPNPFNQRTTIRYQLPEAGPVSLRIYNSAGQLIRTLVEEEKAAGYYTVAWDGRDASGMDVSSGVYFCRLQAGDIARTRRMVLLR